MEPVVLVHVENLRKTYGKTVAVDCLSFQARRGEILGILGPNGSGKTTTLKSILGLVYPDSGEIQVNGLSVQTHRKRVLENAGAVLEGARNIYWYLSPRENLLYFAGIRGLSARRASPMIDELLKKLELYDVRNKEVRQFSSGMKQKVAMACAFVHDPGILFLDEPTMGLDVEIALSIRDWLRSLVREHGKTILVTSHDMGFVESLCDRVLIIRAGRIVSDETLQSLKARFSEKTVEVILETPLTAAQTEAAEALGPCRTECEGGVYRFGIRLHQPQYILDLMSILRDGGSVIKDFSTRENDLENIFLQMIRKGS
jgi:ABC-2 type transport system ATP-binding protein